MREWRRSWLAARVPRIGSTCRRERRGLYVVQCDARADGAFEDLVEQDGGCGRVWLRIWRSSRLGSMHSKASELSMNSVMDHTSHSAAG